IGYISDGDAICLIHVGAGTVAAGDHAIDELLNVSAVLLAVAVHVTRAVADLRDGPEATGQLIRSAGHWSRERACVGLADGAGERQRATGAVHRAAAVDGRPCEVESAAGLPVSREAKNRRN